MTSVYTSYSLLCTVIFSVDKFTMDGVQNIKFQNIFCTSAVFRFALVSSSLSP
jgi:hypothetical protein